MNNLILRKIFSNFIKNKSILSKSYLTPSSISSFSTKKKTTKPNSGSDIEVDKSKKSLRSTPSDNDTEYSSSLNDNSGYVNQNNTTSASSNTVSSNTNTNTTNNSNNNVNNNNNKNDNTPSSNTKESKIESVPNHKPPISEDSVAGRYAHTLFTVASQNKELYKVNEDMKYILEVYTQSESFRTFSSNSGLGTTQLNEFLTAFNECASFSNTTNSFVDLLGKNKRFMYINDIAKKFIRSYSMLSKEEKITHIYHF